MNWSISASNGDDAVLRSAAVKELGAPCVPGGEVAQRALAVVLVLDALAAWMPAGGECWVLATARLDRGLLVGADDVVAGMQPLALPAAFIEIKDRAGLLGEARVAREDPRAVLPGPDRVLRQPAPDGDAADLLHNPAHDGFAREFGA